jgi:hypothetical protein
MVRIRLSLSSFVRARVSCDINILLSVMWFSSSFCFAASSSRTSAWDPTTFGADGAGAGADFGASATAAGWDFMVSIVWVMKDTAISSNEKLCADTATVDNFAGAGFSATTAGATAGLFVDESVAGADGVTLFGGCCCCCWAGVAGLRLCSTSFRSLSSRACFSPRSIAGLTTCGVGAELPTGVPDLLAAVAAASSILLLAIFSSSSFCRAKSARFVKLGSVGAFFIALGSDGTGVDDDDAEDKDDADDAEVGGAVAALDGGGAIESVEANFGGIEGSLG